MQSSFQRQSVVAQVAASLEQELLRKTWKKSLPSERELSARFGVGRLTLRAALLLLRRKGLVRTVSRSGTAIIPRRTAAHARGKPEIVGLLVSHQDFHTIFFNLLVHEVEHNLHAAGYNLLIQRTTRGSGKKLNGCLRELAARSGADCWILCSVSMEVQHWFMRRQIPAVVLGSCHAGITLPELAVDYKAVGRHAMETLLRLGHRRIAYLALKQRYAGDCLGEAGIQEACKAWKKGEASCGFFYHDGSINDLRRVMNSIFIGKERPTALIVVRPNYALAAVGHLINKGFRVPDDVSIICRDDDDFLGWFIPPVGRYAVDVGGYARRCARAVISLLTGARMPIRLRHIMPRFVPGGTVAAPSRSLPLKRLLVS